MKSSIKNLLDEKMSSNYGKTTSENGIGTESHNGVI